jgi:hypothetical protein
MAPATDQSGIDLPNSQPLLEPKAVPSINVTAGLMSDFAPQQILNTICRDKAPITKSGI